MIDNSVVLYEDERVCVINKPSGLSVHPDGRTPGVTLVDWINEHIPSAKGVGEPLRTPDGTLIDRPGIVHRLDKDTSGVMVIAKTTPSYLFLKRQFMSHVVKKKYHAFVYGDMKDTRGTIRRSLTRSRQDARKRVTASVHGSEGKEAVTEWHTLLTGSDATFVEARPLSGRTHQIRVHFQSVGHPIVADPLYASTRKPLLHFTRLALHARSLTFRAPGGEEISVEAPYPDDFTKAIELFRAAGAVSPQGLRFPG